MESTFDDLNKPQNNPFFPCSFDQNLLLINSPKISPSKRPNILLKHPCSAGIKPDSFNKRKPDLKINLYRGTEEGRRKKSFKTLRIPNKAPSFLTNMLRSPFLRNFYPNQSKILIKSAQLRNNEYLKEYYEEKIQTRNTEYKRKDKTSKFTKKMPYYKVFTKFSQLVIGILRLKAFIRRKKTEKYVKLFSEHLKGGFYHNYIDNLPPIDLAHTYQSLIQREPFSDPYFIYVIERVSFTSIIKEFNSKKKGLYNWVILIYKAISFSCNRLVNSQGFKVITLLIVQANCYCLYREFYLLEETIPESLCVNLTGYPIQKSSYHSFNDWVIYFFLIEMILKLIALGIIEYLKDLWNIGDLIILGFNYHYMYIDNSTYFQPIPFRIFRFINLFKIKALQTMVSSLGKSLLLLSETFFILLFFGALFAISGVQIFNNLLKNRCYDPFTGLKTEDICGNLKCEEGFVCWKGLDNMEYGAMSFDGFGEAFLLVMRIMTLSVWSPIMYSIQRSYSNYSWIYFVLLIICGNFFLLNLNLAVLKVKFSENYERIIVRKEEIKQYNFKELIKKKVIISSKEVFALLKGAPMNTKKRQSISRDYGQIALLAYIDKNPNEKPGINRIPLYLGLSMIKRLIKSVFYKGNNEEINRNKLEIIVNHQKEYFSLSTNDIFNNNREEINLKAELRRNREVLSKKPLLREYSFTNLIPQAKNPLNMPSNTTSRRISLIKRNPLKEDLITPENPLIYVRTMKSPKKSRRELKLVMEKKLYRKLERKDLDFNYNSIKNEINKQFKEEIDLDPINCFKLYVKILENDIKGSKISQFHWSGLNVLPSHHQNENYWKNIFLKLSQRDFNISWLRKVCIKVIESTFFGHLSMIFIIITSINLSLDGSIEKSVSGRIFLVLTHFFLLEFGLKLGALGLKRYIGNWLNKLDLIILAYSLCLVYFEPQIEDIESNNFKSLRLIRIIVVFRILRLLNSLEFMKFILLVLRTTFHYFIYIAFFLILLILVFSLIAKQIYSRGCDFSGILQQEKSFGSFSSTLVTIFNLITLDNWNSLITAAYKANLQLPLIFISLFLIFFGNFIVLNLFIAIMLDSFEKVKKQLSEKVLSEVKDKEKTNKQLYLELKNPLLTKENPLDLIKQLDSEIFTEEEPFIRDETISPITVALQNPFKNAPFDIKGLEKVPCESSLYLFNKASIIRRTCYKVVHSAYFERVIYLLIISVSIVLALDTFLESSFWVVELCNIAINSGFLLESLMKIISEGLLMDKGSYLRDYKSVLDFLTIGLSFFGLFGPRYNSLKAVLLIRLWRPFSIIYKRKYIKDLINALISSLYQIINVFIVVFTVWFVFSLIGIQLFRNRFGFCENRVNYHVSFEECQNTKKKWSIFFLNYDDIGSALISIFVLSTMDNWANQLNIGVNSDLPERGPSRNNNQFSSYCFFLAFVIIAVWLFYNLFIGVIFSNFIETSQRNLHPFLTPSQVKWLEIQDFILKLDEKVFYLPKKGFRLFLYRILERKVFEWVLKVILAVNFLILAIYSEELKKKSWYRGALYSLCTFFLLEAFIKIFVYRRHYFISKWGVFNLLAALAYLIDILFLVFEKEIEALGFGWKFIRLAHVLIVVSLIRIIEKLTGLRDILMTIFLSWRLLMNMILLMFIVLFIYAVIGVYMFKEVIQGEVINENNNFSNLFYALMTLFKCLTREEWSNLLFDLSKTPPNCEDKKDCGSRFTPLYLISFMIFNTYIIFNLFILILLQQFEEFHKNIFNPMVVFKQYLGPFKIVWDRISIKGKRGGDRELHITKLLKLFKELGPPLGIDKKEDWRSSAKKIVNYDLKCDLKGTTYFKEVIYSTMRNYFRDIIFPLNITEKALKHIFHKEKRFYYKLEYQRMKREKKKNLFDYRNFKIINPLHSYFSFIMFFKAWKGFSLLKIPLKTNEVSILEDYENIEETLKND